MYAIRHLCPRTDAQLGAHGFSIDLSPEWKFAVAASGLNQEKVDHHIKLLGNDWLSACGYNSYFDPDNSGIWADRSLPPGPNAVRSPDYRHIQVKWGEWGPEHISVPGSACGLDLDRGFGSLFREGRQLTPHNIDSWSQKQLLLIVFCDLAESVILFSRTAKSHDE